MKYYSCRQDEDKAGKFSFSFIYFLSHKTRGTEAKRGRRVVLVSPLGTIPLALPSVRTGVAQAFQAFQAKGPALAAAECTSFRDLIQGGVDPFSSYLIAGQCRAVG